MEFKASLDPLAKGITFGIILLFAYLGWRSIKVISQAGSADTSTLLTHGGILLLFLAILVFSLLWSPRGYSISKDRLLINRFIGPKSIELSSIGTVEPVDRSQLSGTLRAFGVGGLFGYFGKFHSPNYGMMDYYVTQRKNFVLIRTNEGKKIILSPDDTSFSEILRNSLP